MTEKCKVKVASKDKFIQPKIVSKNIDATFYTNNKNDYLIYIMGGNMDSGMIYKYCINDCKYNSVYQIDITIDKNIINKLYGLENNSNGKVQLLFNIANENTLNGNNITVKSHEGLKGGPEMMGIRLYSLSVKPNINGRYDPISININYKYLISMNPMNNENIN